MRKREKKKIEEKKEAVITAKESAKKAVALRKVSPGVIGGDGLAGYGLLGRIVQWKGITENCEPQPVCVAAYHYKSIEVCGEFGGGNFSIEGANDPACAHSSVMSDSEGDNLAAIGSNKIKAIPAHSYWLKPVRHGGAGMKVDITLILHNMKR